MAGPFFSRLSLISLVLSAGSVGAVKLISAGCGRTGSTSMMEALINLGYVNRQRVYTFQNVLRSLKGESDKWLKLATAWSNSEGDSRDSKVQALLSDILRDFEVVGDYPACAWWQELQLLYPRAMVVLIDREAASWYDSSINTTFAWVKFQQTNNVTPLALIKEYSTGQKLPSWQDPAGHTSSLPPARAVGNMMRQAAWSRLFGEGVDPAEMAAKAEVMAGYSRHGDAVRQAFRGSSNFLQWSVKDGWAPLCDFFSTAAQNCPQKPFPHVNSRGQFFGRVLQPILKARLRFDIRPELPDVQILAPGFGRTGTSSFAKALVELKYVDGPQIYNMRTVLNDMEMQVEHWQAVSREHAAGASLTPLFHIMFRGFKVVTDYPACAWWQEIWKAFPHAKVILTDRDAEAWYSSSMRTTLPFIQFSQTNDLTPLVQAEQEVLGTRRQIWHDLQADAPAPAGIKGFGDMMQVAVWDRLFGPGIDPADRRLKAKVLEGYKQHSTAVRQGAAGATAGFWEWRVGAGGWAPLCQFLSVPDSQCPSVAFPHSNPKEDFFKSSIQPILKARLREGPPPQKRGARRSSTEL